MQKEITYSHYSKEEVSFIKENYKGNKESILFLAKKLNRSKFSIRHKLEMLGIVNQQKREKVYNISPLTAKEQEILELLYKGLNSKEIAQKLSISITTARTHKNSILFKMDVNSVHELLAKRIKDLENNALSILSKKVLADNFLLKIKQKFEEVLESEG